MATYIKGVTDYIPQIQPFRPDFNFYQNVLARKQQQYDQGWSTVNSLYNSLLNAPMTRPEDIAKRDDFFKRAEFEIKRISGLDLSNPTNIDASYKLFKPYYSDENIIHDMRETKRAMNNYQKGNALRHETDEKKGAGTFWQGGLDYIDLWRKRYSESNNEEALRMSAPEYTPFFDIRKHMMADIKDNDFEMIRESAPGGMIKMTYKNGSMMIPNLSTYYEGMYANDPQAQQYYKVKAELDQYSWMENNKGNYDSDEAAENAYITETLNSVIKSQNTLRDDIKSDTETIDYMTTVYDEYTEKYGGRSYITEIQGQLSSQKEALVKSKQSLDTVNLVLNNGDKVDLSTYRGRSAALKATMLMRQDVLSAAENYAMLTSEETWDYDEKWMADYKSGLALDEYKAKALIDLELERIQAEQESKGGIFDNVMQVIKNEFGSFIGEDTWLSNLMNIDENEKNIRQLEKDGSYSFVRAAFSDAAMNGNINSSLTAFTNILLKGAFDKDTRKTERDLKKKLKALQYQVIHEYRNNNSVSQETLDNVMGEYMDLIGKHMNVRDVYKLASAAVSDGGKLNGIGWFNMLAEDTSPLKTWYKDNYQLRNETKVAKDALNTKVDLHSKAVKDAYVKLKTDPSFLEEDEIVLDAARHFNLDGEHEVDFLSKDEFPSEEQFIAAYLSRNQYEDRGRGPLDVIGRNLGYIKDDIDAMIQGPWASEENILGRRALTDHSAARQVYDLENINIAKERYKRLAEGVKENYGDVGSQFGFDTPGAGTYVPGITFQGQVNAQNKQSRAHISFAELAMDIMPVLNTSGVQVKTGAPTSKDGLLTRKSVPKGVAEQIIRDVFNSDLYLTDKDGKGKDRKNPYLNFAFYGAALNDPDKVAIHIKPNPYYVKEFASGSKATEEDPGSKGAFYGSDIYENMSGFTIYMDRKDVNYSQLAEQQKASNVDILLQNGKEINIDNFPSAGNVTFKKGSVIQTNSGLSYSSVGNDIIASYMFKGFTISDNKIVEKPAIEQYVNIGPFTGINADLAVSQASDYLYQMSVNNRKMKDYQIGLENGKYTMNDIRKFLGLQSYYSNQMQGLEQNSFQPSTTAEDFLLGGLTNEQ
tara:strand:- start:6472 stop:9768 length:3297 start_codon:yes stop_codon:yes gene_type:complete